MAPVEESCVGVKKTRKVEEGRIVDFLRSPCVYISYNVDGGTKKKKKKFRNENRENSIDPRGTYKI